MSQAMIHDRNFFYKYFTFGGAKKTLESGSFLYKTPALFNDPFDSQLTIQPGVSENEISDLIFDFLVEAILQKRTEPRLGLTQEKLNTFSNSIDKKCLNKIKNIILSYLPKDHFTQMLQQAAEGEKTYYSENFAFCVTEEFDNLLMWSHYPDEHKGLVFKIKCIEE